MARTSKILRRSGNAVVQYCGLIEYEPETVVMVGVGNHHQEVDVMREVWPEMELFGFEPNPDIYASIVKSFPGRLYDFGIACECGPKKFYSKPNHKDGSSIFPRTEEQQDNRIVESSIQCVALDEMKIEFGELGSVLLWLDCEGSELGALRGGEEWFLPQKVDVINVEMTGKPRCVGWPSPKDIHDWLVDHGFRSVWRHTTRSSIGQFDAIYVKKELLNPDFCCCPCSLDLCGANKYLPLALEVAQRLDLCRICGEGSSASFDNHFVLNYGAEFAHQKCLEKNA